MYLLTASSAFSLDHIFSIALQVLQSLLFHVLVVLIVLIVLIVL
jgi:hypothetical protein